jgi:predicted nucleotidyltransferase
MPSLDPALESVVTALVRGLRALEVPFCVVGALVPELLLETRPESRTNDADVVVIVPDLAAFAEVKQRLAREPYNFMGTTVPHRLRRRGGGLVDVIPYSPELSPDGVLRLEPGIAMNTAGFDRVIGTAIQVRLDSGLELPVVPLPLYVLLKLVAYSDRKMTKDLEGVEHVLRHYASDDDRLWGLEYEGALVEYDYGPAYLLGRDGTEFLGPDLIKTLQPLLASLSDAGARLRGPRIDDGEWRPGFKDLLLWYRRGLGL